MVALGWLLLVPGVALGVVAIVLRRRKVAIWYTLGIIALVLMLIGVALVLSLTIGNRAGQTVKL
jgi:hypothetical protein